MQQNKEIAYRMDVNDNVAAGVADAMGPVQLCIKRAIDFAAASLGLIVLSPLMLALYILLKAQRNGPAVFTQERIGQGGRAFTIYKFRTMSGREDSPVLTAKACNGSSTRLERFLRERHLDELPQLWNVLKGDMSIVGPRPERKYFIDRIIAAGGRYELIYAMKPGLTSEATLYNGYTDTMEKMLRRLEMDISYMRRRTLLSDLGITLRTAASMLGGRKF